MPSKSCKIARDYVAFDEKTLCVPLATKVILFWKYIYLILFLFLPHAVVQLARTPNIIWLIRNLPNKITYLDYNLIQGNWDECQTTFSIPLSLQDVFVLNFLLYFCFTYRYNNLSFIFQAIKLSIWFFLSLFGCMKTHSNLRDRVLLDKLNNPPANQ